MQALARLMMCASTRDLNVRFMLVTLPAGWSATLASLSSALVAHYDAFDPAAVTAALAAVSQPAAAAVYEGLVAKLKADAHAADKKAASATADGAKWRVSVSAAAEAARVEHGTSAAAAATAAAATARAEKAEAAAASLRTELSRVRKGAEEDMGRMIKEMAEASKRTGEVQAALAAAERARGEAEDRAKAAAKELRRAKDAPLDWGSIAYVAGSGKRSGGS